MRALLLLVVIMLVGVPVALLDAAPVPKEAARPPLLDCTGPKGADAKVVRASQQAWAKFLGEKSHEKKMALDKEGKVLIEMVLVPPGKYYRGSPEGKGHEDERPQKVITISKPMWVGKYEVTQAQYMAVTGEENPTWFPKEGAQAAKYPVENVSYDEAVAFCQAARGGKFQLLTEAEWEYAYRAGSRTEWYNGDEEKLVQEIAQCESYDQKAPSKLGIRIANALGLHDMAGNVCEWCSDWYSKGYYKNSPQEDPTGPESASERVYRGGSWVNFARICRTAYRCSSSPDYRSGDLGFRLAVVPSGE